MERKCESMHSKRLSCRTPTAVAFSSPYVTVVMRVKCGKTVTRGAWKKLSSRTRNAPGALFARLMKETFALREHRCSGTWTRAPSSRLVALFSGLSFSLVWDSTYTYIYIYIHIQGAPAVIGTCSHCALQTNKMRVYLVTFIALKETEVLLSLQS